MARIRFKRIDPPNSAHLETCWTDADELIWSLMVMNPLRRLGNWWRKPVFDGEIGRMIIVAAPAGAGKSTFVGNPHAVLGTGQFPEHLSDLARLGRSQQHLFQLYRRRSRRIGKIAVQCDILAPFFTAGSTSVNRSDVLARMSCDPFWNNRKLSDYCGRAEELDIVILFVRREKNLQRWAAKDLTEDAYDRREVVNSILQDDSNQSELHRAMYRSWLEFSESVDPRSITVIDANEDDKYAVMKMDDFRRELDEGY